MADPPRTPDSRRVAGAGDDSTDVRAGRGSTTGAPRWVKVFGIIVIVLVALFVILQLIGGGSHGPGRHAFSGSLADPASLSRVIAHGVR